MEYAWNMQGICMEYESNMHGMHRIDRTELDTDMDTKMNTKMDPKIVGKYDPHQTLYSIAQNNFRGPNA